MLASALLLFNTGASAQAAASIQSFADPGADAPARLADTGLNAPGSHTALADGVMPFSPQYPLWSDGAAKRRWVWLPPGTQIDASDPDRWRFPVGTKLWKEFGHAGKPVETRLIELKPDGHWRFAAYAWNAQGTEATLVPRRGLRLENVRGAPGGRYTVPSRTDCLACHGSAAVPVLGFSALQLSQRPDPLAPGGRPRSPGELDLRALVERGLLRGLPARLLQHPPEIVATTPVERAALGYLHANCAHCHNTSDQRVPRPLTLAQRVADPEASHDEVLRSMVGASSRWKPQDAQAAQVIAAGDPDHSALVMRMRSREPRTQMPPLGTQVADRAAIQLILQWLNATDFPTKKENAR